MESDRPHNTINLSAEILSAKLIPDLTQRDDALRNITELCVTTGNFPLLIALNGDNELSAGSRQMAESLIVAAAISGSAITGSDKPLLEVAHDSRLSTGIRDKAGDELAGRYVQAGDFQALIGMNRDNMIPWGSRRLAESRIIEAVFVQSKKISETAGTGNAEPFLQVACDSGLPVEIREGAATILVERVGNMDSLRYLASLIVFPSKPRRDAARKLVEIYVAAGDMAKLTDFTNDNHLVLPIRLEAGKALILLASELGEYAVLAKMAHEIRPELSSELEKAIDPAANAAMDKPAVATDFALMKQMSNDPLLKDATRARAATLLREAVPSGDDFRTAVTMMERRSPATSDVVPKTSASSESPAVQPKSSTSDVVPKRDATTVVETPKRRLRK